MFGIHELHELRVQRFRSATNDNAIDGKGKHVPPVECLLQARARFKPGIANGGGARVVSELMIALTMSNVFALRAFLEEVQS